MSIDPLRTDLEKICPGIVEVVNLLNAEGFTTTDSGDGSHFKDGMEGAFEEPMVACQEKERHDLVGRAKILLSILRQNGFEAKVEASYSPNDNSCMIIAYGEGLRSK